MTDLSRQKKPLSRMTELFKFAKDLSAEYDSRKDEREEYKKMYEAVQLARTYMSKVQEEETAKNKQSEQICETAESEALKLSENLKALRQTENTLNLKVDGGEQAIEDIRGKVESMKEQVVELKEKKEELQRKLEKSEEHVAQPYKSEIGLLQCFSLVELVDESTPGEYKGYIAERGNTVPFEFSCADHSSFYITNELWKKMSHCLDLSKP